MRKAILCVIVGLVFAGVASALSTPMGGTFYWTSAATDLKLAYLDVDSNWAPVSAATAQSTLTLTASSTVTYGFPPGTDTWYNPATGQRDETALHSGYVFAAVRFDNIQDPLSTNPAGDPTGTAWPPRAMGFDILALDSTGGTPGLTSINGGWDYKAHLVGPPEVYYPQTTTGGAFYSAVVVDSGFTPNGEAKGFYFQTSGERGWVWTVDSNGTYNTATQATDYNGFQTEGGSVHGTGMNYARLNGNINFGSGPVAVTGVVGLLNGPTASRRTYFTYKLAGGGYQSVMSYDTNGYNNGIAGWQQGDYVGISSGVQIGDTDNDGKLDAYYETYNTVTMSGGGRAIIHAEDTNGDGDFLDASECVIGPWIHIGTYGSPRAIELINLGTKWDNGNDQWGLAFWQYSGTAPAFTAILRIGFLDSDGNYDSTQGLTTIDSVSTTDGITFTGDASMAFMRGYNSLTFVPLVIPEPGTLLLVGTGVLGLAGVLRRRLLS